MTEEKLYPYKKPAPRSLDPVATSIGFLYLQVALNEEFGVDKPERVLIDLDEPGITLSSFSGDNLDKGEKLVRSLIQDKTDTVTTAITHGNSHHKELNNATSAFAEELIAEDGVVKSNRLWMELTPQAAVGIDYGMIPLFSSIPPPFLASPHVMEVMSLVVKLRLHEKHDTWRYVFNPPPAANVVFPIRSDASFQLSTKWEDASIVDRATCMYFIRPYDVEVEVDDIVLRINVYTDQPLLSDDLRKALMRFFPHDNNIHIMREDRRDFLRMANTWIQFLHDDLVSTHPVDVVLDSGTYGHTQGPEQLVVSTLDPNWDICKPTVYFYNTKDAPGGSIFREEEVQRMIALLVAFRGHSGMSCVIREGPNARDRLSDRLESVAFPAESVLDNPK